MNPLEVERFDHTLMEARKRYERDIRFRNMAQAVVARTMQQHGPVDPEEADREAHDIALSATATLLEMIYREDAELMSLRVERDAYKKFAEESVGLRPMPPIFMDSAHNAHSSQNER